MLRWSVLTDVMEVRPLSLSRLQVLCHSLSKVLFKLSLTLLVRYRSSYSVFNFGRHIPAASHCIPKQCYSLDAVSWGYSFWLNGLPPGLGSILTWEVGSSKGSALHIEFHQSVNQPLIGVCATTQTHLRAWFGNESGPCSVAPDWGNHGCFLFLRWIICLS